MRLVSAKRCISFPAACNATACAEAGASAAAAGTEGGRSAADAAAAAADAAAVAAAGATASGAAAAAASAAAAAVGAAACGYLSGTDVAASSAAWQKTQGGFQVSQPGATLPFDPNENSRMRNWGYKIQWC